ncbi:MAG TPA: oligosaccharide flippase family protein [Gaiellales bacterium]|nr:oligosaccharide flippase family protein [Gaiellales bacterium]
MTDERTLLAGTGANVIGLAAGVVAAFGVQLLLGRSLPHGGLALVTVAVQFAFVAAAGARFGMDLASVRAVAIGAGAGDMSHLRSLVDRCAGIALAAGVVLGAIVAALSPLAGDRAGAIAVGAAALPLIATANVYLGATRGLKKMGPTLWVFWIGQPVAWIGLAVVAIALGGETTAAIAAYDLSWLGGLVAAWWMWRRLAAWPGGRPATRAEVAAVLRYGAPRAPSALLAQALFWGDLFVLTHYDSGRSLDAYAAAARISQLILLFLTSVNLVFSPFAADLHARGQRERLDALFKRATRWALAATLPLAIVLFVAAPQALQAFGPGYAVGSTPLRIMLVGQTVNVATGGVAFVLVMAGYTGLDLADNLLAAAVLLALAIPLAAAEGPTGAAAASATALALVNLVRLAQVHRRVGVQPFDAAYGRLALPAAGCLAAAWAARAVTDSHPWWVVAAATTVAGAIAYAVLLPAGLPAAERSAVASFTRRISNRPR